MANDHSTIIVVPDANKNAVSKVLAAFWGDDAPGTDEFSVELSASGVAPATHWLLHTYQTNPQAAVVTALPTSGGTLPAGINLVPYSVSTQDAKDACAMIPRVSVKTGAVTPGSHVQDVLTELGLVEIP